MARDSAVLTGKNIYLSSKLHTKLLKYIKKHHDDRSEDRYQPYVFMLGKNKKGIVDFAMKLEGVEGGCREMPTISSESAHKNYIKMAKKGYTPCGLVRVSADELDDDGYWSGNSGDAIEHSGEVMLTVAPGQFVAQRGYYSEEKKTYETINLSIGLTNKLT